MNQLLEQLDKWVNFTDPNNKQTRPVGLTIHWSVSGKEWRVGYGHPRNFSEKHWGRGATVELALQDKLNKLNL